jgi:hypothetical protein
VLPSLPGSSGVDVCSIRQRLLAKGLPTKAYDNPLFNVMCWAGTVPNSRLRSLSFLLWAGFDCALPFHTRIGP